MKKIFKTMLIVIVALSTFMILYTSAGAESEVYTEGYLRYVIQGEEVMISGCDVTAQGELIIPEKLGGYPVTKIGMWAFKSCTELTSVTIPEGVTRIGIEAFYWCKGLTSVTLPSTLTAIENGAFKTCTALKSITLPEGLTYIGDNAFYNCKSLTNAAIGSSVKTIGKNAFYQCEQLTSITIPDTVTNIGAGAFYYCYELVTITIPKSVTEIGSNVFYYCSSLTDIIVDKANEVYCSVDGVLYNKAMTELVRYPQNKPDTAYEIPEGVTTIHYCAFVGSKNLTSVTIPDSVTTFYNSIFSGCSSLKSIEIPSSATVIGDYMFKNCESLTSITIPYGITTIGEDMFYDCIKLTDITIPNSVTNIEAGAFQFCTGLENVYYIGTQEQWKNVSVDSSNSYLSDATIHYIKPSTSTSITQETGCKKYSVKFNGIPAGSAVTIACYNGNTLVYTDTKSDNSKSFSVSDSTSYNKVKIFVWDTLSNMYPVTDGEIVK